MNSIGCIDFANNEFYEVMVDSNFPRSRLWLCPHDGEPDDPSNYITVSQLIEENQSYEPTILAQIGSLLQSKDKGLV